MLDTTVETDVLIVGAGPVGLFLAHECARRSLRWRLIETHPSQSIHSKALAIFPRTMEIFDMAGVVKPFLQVANRATSVAVFTQGKRLAAMNFAPDETRFPFIAMVPQNVTEELLAAELTRKGGVIEYNTTFLSAQQDADKVIATLTHADRTTQVSSRYLVGCDGAHSSVRKSLGLTLQGGEYPDAFLLADIATGDTLPADELQLCPSELGPVAIFPMSATRRRVVAMVQSTEADAPSLALVQKILAERGPLGMEAHALHWSSYFHIHHLHATALRQQRMFIAGDASHLHSPFGGQGMNTGLHDVWNLVWKLDLSLRGFGNEALLDSYSDERIPVIKSVVETTDFLTRAMGSPNKFAQVLRDALIPMVSRLAPFQHAFVQRLSELGIAYPGSPIIEGPGKRHFDDSLRGGAGIKSHFLLLVGHENAPADRDAAQQFAAHLHDVLEYRLSSASGITLLRPDGYVAYANAHAENSALSEIRRLLVLQTSPPETPGERIATA